MDRKQFLLVTNCFFRLVSFTLDQSSRTKIARPGDGFFKFGAPGLDFGISDPG